MNSEENKRRKSIEQNKMFSSFLSSRILWQHEIYTIYKTRINTFFPDKLVELAISSVGNRIRLLFCLRFTKSYLRYKNNFKVYLHSIHWPAVVGRCP